VADELDISTQRLREAIDQNREELRGSSDWDWDDFLEAVADELDGVSTNDLREAFEAAYEN
jgi:hypothetical protein